MCCNLGIILFFGRNLFLVSFLRFRKKNDIILICSYVEIVKFLWLKEKRKLKIENSLLHMVAE